MWAGADKLIFSIHLFMLISGAFNGKIKGLIVTSCINKLVVVTTLHPAIWRQVQTLNRLSIFL